MPAPAFITSILSRFPVVEYPEEPCYPPSASSSSSSSTTTAPYSSSAPEHPTFWLYGPGVNNERESFDVECLRLQAEAVFAGIETRTRWLDTAEGAPGATLPALHLPNGDLLPAGAISAWIAKNGPNATGSQHGREKDGYTVDGEDKAADAGAAAGAEKTDQQENVSLQARTYTSLVESKLQPALLAHLFLVPHIYDSLTTPLYFPQTRARGTPEHPALPLLTRYAHSALSYSRKLEMQAELAKALSPGSAGASGSGSGVGNWFGRGGPKLDLEDVQRQGEECIDLLAAKLENEGRGWFFGTEQATKLDAILYANLHIAYILHEPKMGAGNPYRRKLEKHPELFRWVKRVHKDYFS